MGPSLQGRIGIVSVDTNKNCLQGFRHVCKDGNRCIKEDDIPVAILDNKEGSSEVKEHVRSS